MNKFEVFIPVLPPGINDTYKPSKTKEGKPYIYKNPKAKKWQADAALLIGSAANVAEFVPSDRIKIDITTQGANLDVDAPAKLVIDTIAEKLGFNDKVVEDVNLIKKPLRYNPDIEKGVLICVTNI